MGELIADIFGSSDEEDDEEFEVRFSLNFIRASLKMSKDYSFN